MSIEQQMISDMVRDHIRLAGEAMRQNGFAMVRHHLNEAQRNMDLLDAVSGGGRKGNIRDAVERSGVQLRFMTV